MIRWGVIGAGGFADRRAIPGMLMAPNVALQAVMVRDARRAQELAGRHGAPEAYDNLDDMLGSPNVDAVYVCTPVDLHREHTAAAALAGKHVLCEKPMSMTAGDCQAMIDVCQENGVRLGIAYMMRYRAHCQVARKMIEDGNLGQIVSGRAQNTLWSADSPGAWRQEMERGGGGALPDIGSHCIDTLRFLMGEVVEVNGLTASAQFDYRVDDTTQAILRFENGALGMIDCSFAIPNRQCPLEIYGTKGTLLISRGLGPFTDPQVRFLTEEGETEIQVDWVDPYAAEFEAMSAAIEEGRDPEVDGWEGFKLTQILLAIQKSATRSEPVTVKPDDLPASN